MDARQMIREGVVSSVDKTLMTARVAFEDMDGLVSAELGVLTRGSGAVRDFWLPDVGDTVVCLFAPNDDLSGEGWIIGTRFHEKSRPPGVSERVRRIEFDGGTFFEYDRESGNLTINVTGNVKINARRIDLNS